MISAIIAFVQSKINLFRIGLIAAIIIAIAGAFWNEHRKMTSAIKDKLVAEHARDVAIENLGKVEIINKQNQATITQMVQDQALREKIQRDLKTKMKNDQLQIDSLLAQITNSKPQEDASIAPILAKTINSIQIMRDLREKGEDKK